MQRPFAAYEGSEPYTFVCYAHDDRDLVYPEIVRLRETGFYIWYDEGIAPGSEWTETLARHIKECGTFLYFVTPNSVASEHCRREVNFALEQTAKIVVVHLLPTTLPDGLSLSLSSRQGILKYEHPQASYYSKLDRALRSDESDQPYQGRASLQLGEWTLDVGTERLMRGEEVHGLDPKELSVLLHLVDRAPDVVTTDGLLSRTWPDVIVGDNVLRQVVARLRRALGDDARNPRYIETLPRRGYRLCAEVARTGGSAQVPRPPADPAVATGRDPRRYLRAATAVLMAVLLVLGTMVWFGADLLRSQNSDRQRLAVSAFDFPSGDQRLERYAGLLSTELVHHLSRIAQPMMDVTQNAGDSHYITRGSLNAVGDAVRLSVQFIQSDGGVVLWSGSLNLPREPTQELIDRLPERLASLVSQIAWAASWSTQLTTSEEAVRELVAGMVETSQMWMGFGGDWTAARVHLERASALDPDYILPPTFLANLYVNRMGGTLRYEDATGPAHAYTQRVLELNEHWTWPVGWVNTHDLDYDAAAANYAYARRAGHPPANMEFNEGLLALVRGHLEAAIAHLETALSIGARENQAMAYTLIAWAELSSGNYRAAANAAEQAVVKTAGTGDYAHLVALSVQAQALCYAGDPGAAREAIEIGWDLYGERNAAAFAGPLACVGDTDAAKQILAGGENRWESGESARWSVYFWGHFHLGELDRAFVWMIRAIEDREIGFLAPLRRSPKLDPIRDDPRYVAAMVRLAEIEAVGTPIESVAHP